jgi:hypothetical protein
MKKYLLFICLSVFSAHHVAVASMQQTDDQEDTNLRQRVQRVALQNRIQVVHEKIVNEAQSIIPQLENELEKLYKYKSCVHKQTKILKKLFILAAASKKDTISAKKRAKLNEQFQEKLQAMWATCLPYTKTVLPVMPSYFKVPSQTFILENFDAAEWILSGDDITSPSRAQSAMLHLHQLFRLLVPCTAEVLAQGRIINSYLRINKCIEASSPQSFLKKKEKLFLYEQVKYFKTLRKALKKTSHHFPTDKQLGFLSTYYKRILSYCTALQPVAKWPRKTTLAQLNGQEINTVENLHSQYLMVQNLLLHNPLHAQQPVKSINDSNHHRR